MLVVLNRVIAYMDLLGASNISSHGSRSCWWYLDLKLAGPRLVSSNCGSPAFYTYTYIHIYIYPFPVTSLGFPTVVQTVLALQEGTWQCLQGKRANDWTHVPETHRAKLHKHNEKAASYHP